MAKTLVLLSVAVALSLPTVAALQTSARAATPSQTPAAESNAQEAANTKLLAAAEPFEALTEQAFSANPGEIQILINQAEKAAQQVNAMLPPEAQSALSKQLADIKQAKANNPSELALASAEGYRIVVSATHRTNVPTAVGLLDYAGFRYRADLKSKPTRWTDMQSAVQFAQEQWNPISGQISDTSLRDNFAAALDRMSKAVAGSSAAAAGSAGTTELDLVDELESYFNPK